jgi:Fic family protein
MHSLSPKYLSSLSYSAEQVSNLRLLGEYRGKQQLYSRQRPQVLAALRTVAIVESSESSNRLEGITAPAPRLKELVLSGTKPVNRSEQEIAGYRDALNLLHESAREMPFTPNVILQLHALVYRYHPAAGGRWKMADNEIVDKGPDGRIARVRFKPVSAVGTPQAMETLAERCRRATEDDHTEPLVVVPLAILDFLCIHPFRDGNGRVARLLTLQLLYHFGYEVGRYISLERIFEETRKTYYETLESSSQGWHDATHDAMPWIIYFWGVLQRAYFEFEERVGTVGEGRGAKSRQVRQVVSRKTLPFRISDLEVECPGISRDTIRHVLRQLRDEGIVAAEGTGRGARWRRVDG